MSLDKNQVALTFDVELWYEGGWQKPFIDNIPTNDTSFQSSIDKILVVLRARGFHATFFVTDEVVNKHPDYVKKISEQGHEVSSHGIDHVRLSDVDPDDYREKLLAHTKRIKDLTGKQPYGFRAPHFSLNKDTSWIIPILQDLGYVYDSSIFPISIIGQYGHAGSKRSPHKLGEDLMESPSGINELPISISSILGIPMPYAGGIYFRFLPTFIFNYLLKKEGRKKYTPIIYFHPHELELTTPRITRGPIFKRILKYWGTKNSFSKFEKMTTHFEFNSIEEIFNLD